LETLAVIGPNADSERNLLGDYSYAAVLELSKSSASEESPWADVRPELLAPHAIHVPTIRDSIQALVSPQTKVLYARGCNNHLDERTGFPEAVAAADQAEVVILILGDKSGLVRDCTTGETRDSSDILLPGAQAKLVEAILATGKPVAVVLVSGRPLAVPLLHEKANAILEAWLPGEEGGLAVAQTLFGDNNPGGKLAMTFPRSAGQIPIFYNSKPSGMRSNWYVDYINEPVTPLYPFGHGLSYTTFEYADLWLDRQEATAGESIAIRCSIRNTGAARGEEVVQLYVCDTYASLPRPVKELKGYTRLALEPGETRTITFHLPVDMLAFYDDTQNLILEPGSIVIMLGSSSEDIRLRESLEIVGPKRMAVANRLFQCPVDV
jgi:beta-glucosidase